MKLAVYHNHPSGGAARAIHQLGRELARRHTVDVYTLTTADEHLLKSEDYAHTVHRFEYSPPAPIRGGFWLNEWQAYRSIQTLDEVNGTVACAIDAGGYDAVLVSACRFAQAPPLLNHLATASIYYCHEPPRRFIDDFCRPETTDMRPYTRLRRLIHKPPHAVVEARWQEMDRRAVAAATRVLANSNFMRDRIRVYYGREAETGYLGIETSGFGRARLDGDYVLSVGAIEAHKGYDFLIRAVGHIDPRRRPRLVIVGNGANPELLRRLKELATVSEVDCRFQVGLSEAELEQAFMGARAFVYTPLLEPFGLAALEAMGHRLPVVAVREGGVAESVNDMENGLLTGRTEGEFSNALEAVLMDPVLSRRLGDCGYETVRTRWSIAAAADRLEQHLVAVATRQRLTTP